MFLFEKSKDFLKQNAYFITVKVDLKFFYMSENSEK